MRSERNERDHPRVLVVGATVRDAAYLVSSHAPLAGAQTVSVLGLHSIRGFTYAAIFVTEQARRHRGYAAIFEDLVMAQMMSPTHLLLGGDGRDI